MFPKTVPRRTKVAFSRDDWSRPPIGKFNSPVHGSANEFRRLIADDKMWWILPNKDEEGTKTQAEKHHLQFLTYRTFTFLHRVNVTNR